MNAKIELSSPPPNVILEMTLDEAQKLRSIIGKIGICKMAEFYVGCLGKGELTSEIKSVIDDVYRSLGEAGVR